MTDVMIEVFFVLGTVYNFERYISALPMIIHMGIFHAEASRLNVGEENDMGEVSFKRGFKVCRGVRRAGTCESIRSKSKVK